ncbi:MAG: hypothetical protein M3426_17575 [Actinomycetota bacterium]|jgi:hypothetical protein|nr:hypothetical protein [Actinomycetota bacterium]
MPKLILATATVLLLGRSPSARKAADGHDGVHSALHARTRSRDATRRLRASGAYEPYFDLAPLNLARRR